MTRQALALSLLEEAGPRGVTTAEFMDAGVGSRYSARLLELRKQGHRITSERVREGSWKYTLVEWKRAEVKAEGDFVSSLDGSGVVLDPAVALKLFESAA